MTSGRATILSADGDDAHRGATAQIFRKAGLLVCEVASGSEALTLAAEGPGLVLLGPCLPDLSGPEVCRRIKANPVTAHIPVLQLVAPGDDSPPQAGADACLVLPVEPYELLANVHALLRKRQERELRRRAEEVEKLMEVMPVGVWIAHDTECRRITGNRAGYELLRTLPGANLSKTAPPGEQPTHFRIFHGGREVPPDELPMQVAATRGAEIRGYEEEIVFADGTRVSAYGSALPLFDEAGRVRGSVAAFMDVSELKRAQEALRQSEARLSLALAASRLGIWEWDIPSRRVLWAGEHAPLFGYPAGLTEATYEHWRNRLHPEDVGRVEQHLQEALTEQRPYHCEYRVVWPDGSVHWIEAAGKCIHDETGQAVRMTGTVVEVSERKRLEEELRRRAEQLSEADRRKDVFLATLAHELRNHLAPVVNALHVLRTEASPPPARQAQETAERQVRQLTRLVDDLLDLSRVTQGKVRLQRQPVELSTVVAQAVETCRPLVEARRHELTVALPAEPVWLEADANRLVQVLTNLLTNSAKYTPAGGKMWLTAERDGAEVVVRARDTGVGIPAELQGRVFELFAQADRPGNGRHGGLGIGLALVKSLVEMHGGSVGVASPGEGQGAEFVLRLPVLTEAPPPPAPPGPPRPDGQGVPCRILIVDDNQDATDSLALLLKLWGHEVCVAYDGAGALERARAFQPSVVLLDLGLPGGMSGYDVAGRLRQEPGLGSAVFVAVSGFGQGEDRRRTGEAGFHDHLVKPVEPDVLKELLSRLRPVGRPRSEG